MLFSFGLMWLFTLLGSNGVLGPFSTLTGVIMSIVGGIGAGIDMKDKC
jgi:hypothetical protein